MTSINRIFDLLDQYRNEYKNKPDALSKKHNGIWKHFSSNDYIELSELFALGLLELGVKPHENIATIFYNSPEWNIIDMGLMQINAIQVPIYPTISQANYRYIFNDAQIRYAFVYNSTIFNRIKDILDDIPTLKNVYAVEPVEGLENWQRILELGRASRKRDEFEMLKSSIKPHDLATIIYTSGTTGKPKGVMLSHRNFISNFIGCAQIPDFNQNDKALSFLPLCHVYERMMNYLYQYFGMSVYYLESTDNLGKNIRELAPEAFCAVPRVLEKTYDKIVRKGRGLKGIKKIIFFWALKLGHRYETDGSNGWWYHFKLKIADKLVFNKWRQALGNRLKMIVSGGASLQPRIARVFSAARIQIMEGYGLTETSPVVAVSTLEPGGIRFGTVGPVLEGVEVKIAPDGEILTRGPNLMLGYYNRPDRTKEVIDDEGWFHTGDIGHLEEGKYLRITDRKKEIFKTSGGKYIAPQVVENRFKESPFIENIIIIGENRNYTTAIIIPDFEHLEGWCGVKGYDFFSRERVIENRAVIARINREVETINNDIDKIEQIKKFILIADEWSVETGELSPTLKLRRKFIIEKYNDRIEELYYQ